MMSSWVPFQSFWSSSWSGPLRDACVWLKRQPGPVVPNTPDALAPDWLRPLCVQRWVGQAIAARPVWMRQHPDQATYLYPEDSIPLWTRATWTPFARSALCLWSEEWMLELFQLEVERLLRLIQAPPALLGEAVWTRAALGTCEHLAQLYGELRRRYNARGIRVCVQQVLRAYVTWEPEEEAEPQA